MKRILNYTGSKWRMSDLIINQMPKHKAYLEP
nr:MAG TPA: Site-specific DNA methylase [Caudoviricetes sp.]